MNSYTYAAREPTKSTQSISMIHIAAGALALASSANPHPLEWPVKTEQLSTQSHTSPSQIAGSNYSVNTSHALSPSQLEQDLATFYAGLETRQRPLGHEFEDLLYSNLTDLYL